MKISSLLPELPFPQPLLSKIFQEQHERNLERFPGWSLLATRRKLTVSYWLKILLNHYGILLLMGILCGLVINKGQSPSLVLTGMIPASIIVFCVLFLAMYWPAYHLEFLPHLDSCMESYQDQKLDGIQQCKKQQFSVVSLMLIHYTYQQMAGLETGLINTQNAKLLAQQYGISVKSIGPAMRLVLRGEWDRKSVRKRTETMDDFETAKDYFHQLSCDKGVSFLDQLQQKILQCPDT